MNGPRFASHRDFENEEVYLPPHKNDTFRVDPRESKTLN